MRSFDTVPNKYLFNENYNLYDYCFVTLISMYMFLLPLLTAVGFENIKIVSLLSIAALSLLWSFDFVLKGNLCFRKPHAVLSVLLLLLLPVYFFVWGNYSAINLIQKPFMLHLFCIRERIFMNVLKAVIVIQFFFLLHEVITSSYIFINIHQGGILTEVRVHDYSKNAQIFKEVGFRPKGLFSGTLVASTFLIGVSVIFYKQLKWLFLLVLMAFMTNGRLAIIISTIILFASSRKQTASYFRRHKMASSLLAVIIVVLFLCIFLVMQSQDAIDNFFNVFDIESSANVNRLKAMDIGISAYFKSYSFVEKLLGNPGYIYWLYASGAESEWISHLLNIGLIGVLLYLAPLLNILVISFRKRLFDILLCSSLIIFALCVYRHTAGFMRGTLFWFYVFTTTHYIRMSTPRNIEKHS